MTDPWARPSGDRPVVEIELSGGDPAPVPGWGTTEPSPPRRPRRRALALGIAGAALAAGAVAVATRGDGDEAAAPTTTALDPTLITTPPTLATLPPATLPGAGDTPGRGTDPGVDSPDLTFPGDDEVFDPSVISVPVFEVVPDGDPAALAAYDLAAAVAANEPDGTPMQTTVTIDGVQADGIFRTHVDATVAGDPAEGLDAVHIERDTSGVSDLIADRAAGVVYRTDDSMAGQWETFTEERFTRGTGAADLGELFDSLLTGPINTATLASATDVVDGGGLRLIDGGTIARKFQVTVLVTDLRPYGQLLIADVSDDSVDRGEAPPAITFDVYVTDEPRLELVAARFESDGLVYSFRQFFDRRPDAVLIELPPPDRIIDGALTAVPPSASTVAPPTSTVAAAPSVTVPG